MTEHALILCREPGRHSTLDKGHEEEARHTQMRDRASGVHPDVLEQLPPIQYDLNQIPYDYTVEVRNRFKGLDLIDRVLDELWMEVRDTV